MGRGIHEEVGQNDEGRRGGGGVLEEMYVVGAWLERATDRVGINAGGSTGGGDM